MKNKILNKPTGRMSRAVMIMAGRRGRRPLNKNYFLEHRERILTAWSRTNLENRIARWTSRHALPSVMIAGEWAYGDLEHRWTSEEKALWEAQLWRIC